MREFIALVSEICRRSPVRRTIVIDTEDPAGEQVFSVHSRTARRSLLLVFFVPVIAAVSIITFTPVRTLIPGYTSPELRRDAILASMRLEALEDSINVQLLYLSYLRRTLTGQIDTSIARTALSDQPTAAAGGQSGRSTSPLSENWTDHEPPALLIDRFPVMDVSTGNDRAVPHPPTLLLPAITPVSGYTTQPFDARSGHYGVDIATQEGRIVRSIGEGYVIFADWTHSGGHTIVVQHADGFISVYKHNQRLLKHTADRVQSREGVAVSGNSGQHTTGPHLHFELWKNGLAQDPGGYLLGL